MAGFGSNGYLDAMHQITQLGEEKLKLQKSQLCNV